MIGNLYTLNSSSASSQTTGDTPKQLTHRCRMRFQTFIYSIEVKTYKEAIQNIDKIDMILERTQ